MERWGILQLTGKYNYTKFAQWLLENEGIDDPNIVKKGAEYVGEKYPFTSAIGWIENNNLLQVCLEDGFDACCYRINAGGTVINRVLLICKSENYGLMFIKINLLLASLSARLLATVDVKELQ